MGTASPVTGEVAFLEKEATALEEDTKPVESAATVSDDGWDALYTEGEDVGNRVTPEVTSSALLPLPRDSLPVSVALDEVDVDEVAEVAEADGLGIEMTNFVPSALLITGCDLRLFSTEEASLVLPDETLA